MRAAIFRNGEIVVDEMPEPRPGAGMVLVKSLACGICGSDLHARKHAHRMVELAKHFPGRKPMDLSRDVVFGHEFCCEVLDYGPGTTRKFKPGTKVCSLPALLTAEGPQGIGYSNDNVGAYAERMLLSEALAAGSSQRPCGRARRADRAAGGRRARRGKSQYQRRRGAAGDRLRAGRPRRHRGAEDQGDCTRSSPPIIRRPGARSPKSSAPTSSSIPRARSLMRPGPSTPRCRRRRKPRGRRCRRCCRR